MFYYGILYIICITSGIFILIYVLLVVYIHGILYIICITLINATCAGTRPFFGQNV